MAAAFLGELEQAQGADRRLDLAVHTLRHDLGRMGVGRLQDEAAARALVEAMARVLQAALMQRHAAPEAADMFCAGRLDGRAGAYGTLPPGPGLRKIVGAARPQR